MSGYLIFASRDPFSERGMDAAFALCGGLADQGDDVTLFLVENGALAARRSPTSARLTELAKGGTRILVDELSLTERGIGTDRLAEGVEVASIDVAVDGLGAGHKTFWV